MKELTGKQVEDGVAALDEMRERLVPQFFQTPWTVFEYLQKKYPNLTCIRQVQMWDTERLLVTFANYAVDAKGKILGPPCNDTNPCPPLW